VVAGSVIKCRAVCVLDTEDEKGTDAKLLAVPVDKVSNGAYDNLRDLADVPERVKNEIHHFYSSYKALEKGKWVKISGWRDAAAARGEIEKGIADYKG
jgi:inorganic pyrophosphatase